MWKEKPSCVVAIPASHEFATIRQAVTAQLQEHDVEPLDYTSDAIVERSTSSSLEAVERSDMLIADVTDKNPNILYGLGLADAMRKPVLLLAQKSPSVPSQLAGHQVVVYEPNETEQLSYYLNSWLKAHPLGQYK